MSLRWKVALAMALMVALTAVAFGTASYRSTRDRLFDEVDRSLLSVDPLRIDRDRIVVRGPLAGFDARTVGPDGTVIRSTFEETVPVTNDDLAMIGRRGSRLGTVATDDGEYRIRTVGLPGGVVQIGRSLDETNDLLSSIRARTLLLAGLITALAAVVGLWIAGRVTASLRRLTTAAAHVEATGELQTDLPTDHDGDVAGRDEVGRLSATFGRMLAALARSQDEQQRLVQDAGHELRTPLTSIRTNLATLRRFPTMSEADRDAIVADLDAETEELAGLVEEIVAVASGASTDAPTEEFELRTLAEELAERVARRTGREIRVDGGPGVVRAQRAAVQRAMSCLIDNAAKFDPSDSPIDVTVHPDGLTVMDRGPGIDPDDLDRVFDRFHRSEQARAMPGSGLGLSIVRAVAEQHGGTTTASNRDGGGAIVGFRLGRPLAPPVAPPSAPPGSPATPSSPGPTPPG